jgi:hypothetical protein
MLKVGVVLDIWEGRNMDAREGVVSPVSGRYGLWFALVALPFILAIGLFAALQPIPRATLIGPGTAAVGSLSGHHGRWGARGPGDFQGTAPVAGPRHWPADMRYRHPMRFTVAPEGYPVGGAPTLGLDDGRFLVALTLGAGLAGVLWAASSGRTGQTFTDPAEAALVRDVTMLREEVDRLRSEQRQLRLSLDWQERLLSASNQADPSADR